MISPAARSKSRLSGSFTNLSARIKTFSRAAPYPIDATTRSPGLSRVTPSPTASTTPANSAAGENGSVGLSWYFPAMISVSKKFSAAAFTRTTASPESRRGSGISLQFEIVRPAQTGAQNSFHYIFSICLTGGISPLRRLHIADFYRLALIIPEDSWHLARASSRPLKMRMIYLHLSMFAAVLQRRPLAQQRRSQPSRPAPPAPGRAVHRSRPQYRRRSDRHCSVSMATGAPTPRAPPARNSASRWRSLRRHDQSAGPAARSGLHVHLVAPDREGEGRSLDRDRLWLQAGRRMPRSMSRAASSPCTPRTTARGSRTPLTKTQLVESAASRHRRGGKGHLRARHHRRPTPIR